MSGMTMTKSFLITLLFCLLSISTSFAKDPIRTIEGNVTKISDGDTIQVTDALGTKVKVRLYGIDAPETEKSNKKTGHISKPGQPYGEESYRALQDKLERQRVRLDVMDIDKYKRAVCLVWLGKRSINKEMVAEGNAWAYRKYLKEPYAREYIRAENQARGKMLGLWQQGNQQPPWEFRKMQRK